eukprot:781857-Pelagomonas_calceolata.AAC.2
MAAHRPFPAAQPPASPSPTAVTPPTTAALTPPPGQAGVHAPHLGAAAAAGASGVRQGQQNQAAFPPAQAAGGGGGAAGGNGGVGTSGTALNYYRPKVLVERGPGVSSPGSGSTTGGAAEPPRPRPSIPVQPSMR